MLELMDVLTHQPDVHLLLELVEGQQNRPVRSHEKESQEEVTLPRLHIQKLSYEEWCAYYQGGCPNG